MTRVLVTGSRAFTARALLGDALDGVGFAHGFHGLLIVHGGAKGADSLADAWVRDNWDLGVRREVHEADWDAPCRDECRHGPRRRRRDGSDYCPTAGIYRNQLMVEAGADLLLAFLVPPTVSPCTGTRDAIRRAEAAGIPVRPIAQQAR